jgi:hypothetical protein
MAMCSFEPRLRLAPSYPARGPLSGVERSVRLSMIAALGSALVETARSGSAMLVAELAEGRQWAS